jgi:hypothetical protein
MSEYGIFQNWDDWKKVCNKKFVMTAYWSKILNISFNLIICQPLPIVWLALIKGFTNQGI